MDGVKLRHVVDKFPAVHARQRYRGLGSWSTFPSLLSNQTAPRGGAAGPCRRLCHARVVSARARRSCASALGPFPSAASLAGGHRVLPLPPLRAFASASRASSRASDPSQPRATTSLTDREILAAQRSPDEYLSVPLEDVRTFSIIAHVDHGKSTLADRLMELTGAVPPGGREQYLDRLPVERARGITVKAQAVSLLHDCPRTNRRYLLNLVDTPGHADSPLKSLDRSPRATARSSSWTPRRASRRRPSPRFTSPSNRTSPSSPWRTKSTWSTPTCPASPNRCAEPSASVATILLLPSSSSDSTPSSSSDSTPSSADRLIPVSAKTGENVRAVLDAVTTRIGPPAGDVSADAPLRALVLDCHYDPYRGAVAVAQIVDGDIRVGDVVTGLADGGTVTSEVLELGLMTPEPLKMTRLRAGHAGYVITSSRDARSAKIGDTLVRAKDAKTAPRRVAPLPGFRPAKPMVFQGLFPASADQHDALRAAVERLALNDASVTTAPETSVALGPGFRCGFLGLLHADVFHQRLREEFDADVISTAPTVPYRVRDGGGRTRRSRGRRSRRRRRWRMRARVETPRAESPARRDGGGTDGGRDHHLRVRRGGYDRGVVRGSSRRATRTRAPRRHAGDARYRLPLGEVASDFSDALKSRTSGFATFDYEDAGWEPSDVVRLDVLVNGHAVDALATLVHRDKATRRGREMCRRLKDALPRQLYEVAVQAAVGGKVLARETISAMRKNVLAKCYGGDVSRKKKLLAKQKEGKRRMRRVGNVDIPAEAFAGLLSTNNR